MTFTLPEMIYNVLAAAVVAGVCCGLIGRAFPTARAVERWLDDAEEMAQGSVRDLPETDLAVDEGAESFPGSALAAQGLQGTVLADVGLTRLPSADERAAMYDTLTNDPPGPDRPAATAPACRPAGDFAGPGVTTREPRNGRGRADRRDYHKRRGPYAPCPDCGFTGTMPGQRQAGHFPNCPQAERHVTLAQAETEAWQWARQREADVFWDGLADLRDEAYEWWRGANWTVAA